MIQRCASFECTRGRLAVDHGSHRRRGGPRCGWHTSHNHILPVLLHTKTCAQIKKSAGPWATIVNLSSQVDLQGHVAIPSRILSSYLPREVWYVRTGRQHKHQRVPPGTNPHSWRHGNPPILLVWTNQSSQRVGPNWNLASSLSSEEGVTRSSRNCRAPPRPSLAEHPKAEIDIHGADRTNIMHHHP